MSNNRYGKRRRNRKKRKTLFVIEIVLLAVLVVVLFVSIWLTRKFSLINHTELNKDNLYTSSEVNGTSSVAGGDTESSMSAESASAYSGFEVIALVGIDTRDEMDGENSDTMILACINHNEKTIKLVSIYRDTMLNCGNDYYGNSDYYSKANAAYNLGGPEQFLSMINLNLDLDVTEFATVGFNALSDTIDLLGGIDVDLTYEEVVHLNNYNVETSAAVGVEYQALELPDSSEFYGAMTRTYHLSGSQAVSYARIRYTDGNDFRRAARQRLVLQKVMDGMKAAGIGTLNNILNAVLPEVTTNIDNAKILSLAGTLISYNITDQTGFPFSHIEDVVNDEDVVVPVTLAYNVQQLHEWILPGSGYSPSGTVQEYSSRITALSGYGEESITLDAENGEIPTWDSDLNDLAIQEQAVGNSSASGYSSDDSSSYSSDYYDDNSYYEDDYYSDEYYDDAENY